jgi:multidrug efflux pump subunit AcrB
VIARRALHLGVFAAIVVAMALLFTRLPTGFLPDEDQGMAMVMFQLPRRHGRAGAEGRRPDPGLLHG